MRKELSTFQLDRYDYAIYFPSITNYSKKQKTQKVKKKNINNNHLKSNLLEEKGDKLLGE